ncbi:dihydrolipoamide acyltransferase, partial [Alistipes onderdonkii]
MLEKGLSAQSRTTATAANTAATMGSGDLGVFATPSMVALMEHAAMTAVAAALPEGSSTVGAEMNVTHIKPSG